MRAMSRLTFLIHLCMAAAMVCLSATVFLIYLYKQGMPYEFWPSMALAAAVGLLVPLFVVQLLQRSPLRGKKAANFFAFDASCLAIATGFGLFTF